MDKQLRKEICSEVRASVEQAMETYQERWVTGDTLQQHIEVFTKAWLKAYGKSLPRTQAAVTLSDGSTKRTMWVYPLHRIQRMIENGQIKQLSC